METSTTTAGFTFAAATEAELEEFRRVREHLPRMMADWRGYVGGPVFARHVQRLLLVSERRAAAMQALNDRWAAGWAELFAQAVLETRPDSPIPLGMTPLLFERHVVHRILWRLAKINGYGGIPTGQMVRMFTDGEIDETTARLLSEHGRFIRVFLRDLLPGKTEFEIRFHQVLEAVFARVEDRDLGHLVAVLPSQLSMDDLDTEEDWAASLARNWTSVSLRVHLAGSLADFRRSDDARCHFGGACWGTTLRFVRQHFCEKKDFSKLTWWSWCSIARLEQENETVFARYRLGIGNHVLSQMSWVWGAPGFWQFLLAAAGPVPAAQLGEGIARFVLSPRTLPRWAVPGDSPAGKLKHVLREISDLAVGDVRGTVQFRHLAARVQSRDVALPERLALFGQILAFAFERTQPADTTLRATVERLLHAALRDAETILTSADCVLCPERLQSPDDAAFNALLAAEAEEARQANDEFQRWMAEALRPENAAPAAEVPEAESGAELPPEEPVALRYVENLGAEQWRLRDFVSARERLGGDLEAFLAEHGIESVVPARSVAEALRHFLYDLTPEQRRELPLEKIAGTGWRKLKRGGQRIYVLERDGAVYFHLLKRRDWVHADLLEARY